MYSVCMMCLDTSHLEGRWRHYWAGKSSAVHSDGCSCTFLWRRRGLETSRKVSYPTVSFCMTAHVHTVSERNNSVLWSKMCPVNFQRNVRFAAHPGLQNDKCISVRSSDGILIGLLYELMLFNIVIARHKTVSISVNNEMPYKLK